jgi:hypothetical protein
VGGRGDEWEPDPARVFYTGDAPLRAATIDMFFHADQLIELCDFSYFHQVSIGSSWVDGEAQLMGVTTRSLEQYTEKL